LFTQEINVKEETFGISSLNTSREDHEARHKSRYEVNKTPNNPRTEASTQITPGDLDVYQRDQLSPRDILAAQDIMIFRCRFGDLNGL
jgi:hypothetical protein